MTQSTLAILRRVKDLNIPVVWLQPGTIDESVLAFMKEAELEDRCIFRHFSGLPISRTPPGCEHRFGIEEILSQFLARVSKTVVASTFLSDVGENGISQELEPQLMKKCSIFGAQPHFAVVGATNNTEKFGAKVSYKLLQQNRWL